MPQSHFSFISSILWETMSNAFWKSTKATATTFSELRAALHVSVRCISSSSIQFLAQYANYLSQTRLFSLKACCTMLSLTSESMILLGTLCKETRQWFPKSVSSTFLINRCKPSCFPTGENHFIFNDTVIKTNREDRICYPDLKWNSLN